MRSELHQLYDRSAMRTRRASDIRRVVRQSILKRTKHLNLLYFFVKVKIDSGDVVIRYCQTDGTRAFFFTKALQVSPFRRHRDFMMNIDPAYYDADHRSVLKTDSQPALAQRADMGLGNTKPGGVR
jgi:hypothetical protein